MGECDVHIDTCPSRRSARLRCDRGRLRQQQQRLDACGRCRNHSCSRRKDTAVGTGTTAATGTPAATAAAATGDPVKIMQIATLTGPSDNVPQDNDAAKAAVKALNA